MNIEQRRAILELVGTPFAEGARGPGALDCLGLTLRGLEILRPDLELRDPWEELAARWRDGWRPEPGEHFPIGWTPVGYELAPGELPRLEVLEGDVLCIGTAGVGDRLATLTHVDLAVWPGYVLRTRLRTGATLVKLRQVLPRLVGIMRPPAAKELAS